MQVVFICSGHKALPRLYPQGSTRCKKFWKMQHFSPGSLEGTRNGKFYCPGLGFSDPPGAAGTALLCALHTKKGRCSCQQISPSLHLHLGIRLKQQPVETSNTAGISSTAAVFPQSQSPRAQSEFAPFFVHYSGRFDSTLQLCFCRHLTAVLRGVWHVSPCTAPASSLMALSVTKGFIS